MKMSVSLPDEDVAFIHEYAAKAGTPTRSAVLQEAVRLLRDRELEDEYEQAWTEWDATGEAEAWDASTADGLDAPR
jgi:Arc/MetJ-type ribon-helix-helix transcriptional regulator